MSAVHVISRRTLKDFWETAAGKAAHQPLLAWFKEARKARWTSPADIKESYRTASFVANDRVIFNIGGNKFRLIVAIIYATKPRAPNPRSGVAYVRFVGTHAQYDKVDAATVQESS